MCQPSIMKHPAFDFPCWHRSIPLKSGRCSDRVSNVVEEHSKGGIELVGSPGAYDLGRKLVNLVHDVDVLVGDDDENFEVGDVRQRRELTLARMDLVFHFFD